ncbi:MAG: hypothetical protein JNM56_22890, partial [Planctomycetia bacterium]|nr:hypothetical protein [Planctomycetia bacterium]
HLARRWQHGERLVDLGVEAGVSWQTLANLFRGAGYRAKDKRNLKAATRATESTPVEKAAKTHQWSHTMIRWLVSRLKTRTRWRLVTFTGPNGGDARGIVDILAVRKDHSRDGNGLKRGDLFELILIQAKGGSARRPDPADIRRLRQVGEEYGAKAVLLAEWIKGQAPVFSRLLPTGDDPKTAWQRLDEPLAVFW